MKIKLKSFLKSIAAIAFWVSVWFVISLVVNQKFILPMPQHVLIAFWELIKTPVFWSSTLFSLYRVVLGVTASFVVGCITAYALSKSKIADALISPLLSVIKATPVACFIVIIWVWVNDTSHLPTFIASLIVIPIVCSNVLQGISSIDKELTEVAKIYKFSPLKKFKCLYLPSIAPFVLSSLRSSLGMAWKASVAAEMIVLAKNSIGKEIYNTKLYSMDEATVFAWTIVVIVLSVILEKLVIYLFIKAGEKMKLLRRGKNDAEA